MSSYALSVDFRWILPKEVYDSRWRKQSWIVVHPTDALAFVRPQDRPHRWAWIEITYFIGLDYLKELCLVCSHAVQWRLFHKASRDRAKTKEWTAKTKGKWQKSQPGTKSKRQQPGHQPNRRTKRSKSEMGRQRQTANLWLPANWKHQDL